jgi:hypothetical protein
MSPRKDLRKASPSSRAPRTRNPGLPDKATVVSERLLVSPKGKSYRIITTTEKDPYDPKDDKDDSTEQNS